MLSERASEIEMPVSDNVSDIEYNKSLDASLKISSIPVNLERRQTAIGDHEVDSSKPRVIKPRVIEDSEL